MIEDVFDRCRAALPGWRDLDIADVDFDEPKGFSSFTMGVRPRAGVDPPAVLYRHLDGKENAILDPGAEKRVFLRLGEEGIAARCLHYDDVCRIEDFYVGRTGTADDVFDARYQRGIAAELHRLHQLDIPGLPQATFFELLMERWGPLVRRVLGDQRHLLPVEEQLLCDDLAEIHTPATLAKVMACLPDQAPVFCHNDTYHGNTFVLDDGRVRLLDFEFSCRGHVAYDIANLFAETVMEHGFVDPPHFRIAPPRFYLRDIAAFVSAYLDNQAFADQAEREQAQQRLVEQTRVALLLPDFMYAMAALPLALNPIQRIRFVPYAHQRFQKFLTGWHAEFG